MGVMIGASGDATVEALDVVVGETGGAMTGDFVEEEEILGAEVMVERLWLEVELCSRSRSLGARD